MAHPGGEATTDILPLELSHSLDYYVLRRCSPSRRGPFNCCHYRVRQPHHVYTVPNFMTLFHTPDKPSVGALVPSNIPYYGGPNTCLG